MTTPRSSKSDSVTGDALLLPILAHEVSLSTLRSHTGLFSRAWGWLKARQVARSSTKRLRVAETVSLGEKRFVAVVQVDGRHFLLAGGPTNIVLLAQLDAKDAFEDVLKNTLTVPGKQAAKRKRPAKRPSRQNAARQMAVGSTPITHLNGTQNFGGVLQKTMSAGRQPGNQPRKQSFKSTAEQTGYYA